jgi:hypothetical protein
MLIWLSENTGSHSDSTPGTLRWIMQQAVNAVGGQGGREIDGQVDVPLSLCTDDFSATSIPMFSCVRQH